MLFRDIAKLTAALLGREDVAEYIESGAGDERVAKEAELVCRCANLSVAQTAAEYAPMKCEEEIYSENGVIAFASLKKNATDILRVSDRHGKELKIKFYPEYFRTSPGTVRVVYAYLPEKFALGDEVPFGDRRVTPSLVAYGAAAEYCLIAGLFDEAVGWNARYVDGMKKVLFGKNKVMKERRWA